MCLHPWLGSILHQHRIKTFIQRIVESSSRSNFAPKTAWRITCIARQKLVPNHLVDTSRYQAPYAFQSLNHIFFAWQDHPFCHMPCVSGLSGFPISPGSIPQAARSHTSSVTTTSFWHFGASSKEPPKQSTYNPKHQICLSSHNHMTGSQSNIILNNQTIYKPKKKT